MKWVTRARPKTDRVACPWLIRRFIDPDGEILYVASDQVLQVAEREAARSFDAPQAEFTHRNGKCTFEVLIAAAIRWNSPHGRAGMIRAGRQLGKTHVGATWPKPN